MCAKLNRRDFLAMAGVGTAAALGGWPQVAFSALEPGQVEPASRPRGTPPNIIFILADDMGYGDLGFFGNPRVETPAIDALAGGGVCLTSHYSAAPVCMPARAAFLTGRYDLRSGARMCVDSRPMGSDQLTLANGLQQAGYKTAIVGKWHLGGVNKMPARFGFDDWYITVPGGWSDYYKWKAHTPTGLVEGEGRYMTDALAEQAVEFIGKNRRNPFFLYLAFNAPHFPLQAPKDEVKHFQDKGLNEGVATIYAMIRRMDMGVERIVGQLKKLGLMENTLIVFTSDNGPEMGGYKGLDQKRYNGYFSGSKGDVLEGGIRVPGVVHWPAGLSAAPAWNSDLIHLMDWTPTLLNLAHGQMPRPIRFDGADVLGVLRGERCDANTRRFWSWNTFRPTDACNTAMRDGAWKLVRPALPQTKVWEVKADLALPDKLPAPKLFRVDCDPFEQNDLSGRYPQRVAQMQQAIDEWFQGVMRDHHAVNHES